MNSRFFLFDALPDFVRAQAARAHLQGLFNAVLHDMHRAQVRFDRSARFPVGVAHIISGHCAFSANITFIGHKNTSFSIVNAALCAQGTNSNLIENTCQYRFKRQNHSDYMEIYGLFGVFL